MTKALNPIIGTEGSDVLYGTAADDVIVSGGGAFDVIFGRGGKDHFDLGAMIGNGTRDIVFVSDFEAGEVIDNVGKENVRFSVSTGASLIQVYYGGDIAILRGITSASDVSYGKVFGTVLSGEGVLDLGGDGLSSAGDVNGDGIDDFLIGAQHIELWNLQSVGGTYVVFGTEAGLPPEVNLSELDGSGGFLIRGDEENSLSGINVSSAGDLNGDGIDDLLIGSSAANPIPQIKMNPAGEAYVVFGSTTGFAPIVNVSQLDGSNGFTVPGLDNGDLSGDRDEASDDPWNLGDVLGVSVAAAGDVNGDGIADILIGAYGADSNGNEDVGATYVIFGNDTGFGAGFDLSTLDGTNGFVVNGATAGDYTGAYVSGVGDVNGDGFDDFLIGSQYPDFNKNILAGDVYLVYGTDQDFGAQIDASSLDGNNGTLITGMTDQYQVGYSVSAAGDVNGDGFADVAICNNNGLNAYVLFGSEYGLGATLDVSTLNGNNGFWIYDKFKISSVASAGDVNGDGIDDFLIGAPGSYNNDPQYSGLTYIIFGTEDGFNESLNLTTLTPDQGYVIVGAAENDRSGTMVSGAGDVNGDGYADILIGSPERELELTVNPGKAYLIYGGPDTFVKFDAADGQLDGRISLENISLNPDMIDPSDANRAPTLEVGTLDAIEGGGTVSLDLATLADDPDPFENSNTLDYYISEQPEIGEASLVGTNLFFAPGLGFEDLLEGETREVSVTVVAVDKTGASTSNVVNITVTGTYDELQSRGTILTGVESGRNFGASIASAGDLNGDGISDFLVSDYVVDESQGSVYVLFGSASSTNGIAGYDSIDAPFGLEFNVTDLDGTNGFVILPGTLNSSASSSVAPTGTLAGDINGDGIDDLILGDPDATEDGVTITGGAYVVFGSEDGFDAEFALSSLDGENGFIAYGVNSAEDCGYSVAGIGDVNDDGFDDILIGAPGYDRGTLDSGAVYLVYGSNEGFSASINLSELNGENGTALYGTYTHEKIGLELSAAGDVNGDGIDDFMISSVRVDSRGLTYIIFGNADGIEPDLDIYALDGTDGFILQGVEKVDQAGISLAAAGDVNGDGIDDILIGAPKADAGEQNDAGKTYVVFGSTDGFDPLIDLATLDGKNGFSISGATYGGLSADSVSSAGDVNGDGIDDILIGEKYYMSPEPSAHKGFVGASHIVFGSEKGFDANLDLSTLNGRNGYTIIGIDSHDHIGYAVASAGDVNSDGYDDILISAPNADQSDGSKTGEAYLVYGGPELLTAFDFADGRRDGVIDLENITMGIDEFLLI